LELAKKETLRDGAVSSPSEIEQKEKKSLTLK